MIVPEKKSPDAFDIAEKSYKWYLFQNSTIKL